MFKALDGVSMGAVDKWYRDTEKGGNEISATNLLRVVISLGRVEEFAGWLGGYASRVGVTAHTDDPPPLPPSSHRPLEVARPKKGKGRRGA